MVSVCRASFKVLALSLMELKLNSSRDMSRPRILRHISRIFKNASTDASLSALHASSCEQTLDAHQPIGLMTRTMPYHFSETLRVP
jgi:hypothetical protein